MMKKLVISTVFFLLLSAVFGQDKPLTQPEFVKMLYSLQQNPGNRQEIIDGLRKRGIDFPVTDGLRGLVSSRSRNDPDIVRAFEEAGRRRENPVAAQLPTPKDAESVLELTRKNTLEAVEEMPDFVVKQQIQRAIAYAGTGNFQNLDRLVVAVSYRSNGEENYRVLSVNGLVQSDPTTKQSYEEVGGTSSTGEFVTMLATVFKPESETKFGVDTDLIRGRKAIVFDFSVSKDLARQQIVASDQISSQSTISGMKGRIWIDRLDARVLRIESEATEIPDSFPVRSAKRVIDYDWVKISDGKYLLPSVSDVRLTSRHEKQIYETRNVIKFKDYQKYGTEVVIRDDDVKPEPETKKPNP
jgi:hypothetical protein